MSDEVPAWVNQLGRNWRTGSVVIHEGDSTREVPLFNETTARAGFASDQEYESYCTRIDDAIAARELGR